ncbi:MULTISPECIES: hypothetical protein [Streptomyces]|uniref:Uncharacterized protein n=2 Tax=Streptomyces TaxID=1883 RepID=A0ABS9J833_9ACTN|nr:hypothetical protein [Streptomyces tricolor]MCG0061720.1 hypothetical protein [Streptomyces tricolor]MYU30687.1 hypothetical protein [Streptomyces sp. SID7810]CUW31765.1 hypothetical protein TUE45_06514 [Streptomyces reticuli]
MQYKHKSVRDYVAAKKRGDRQATDRIVAEVTARFNTRQTDGSEAAELLEATMAVKFGEGA